MGFSMFNELHDFLNCLVDLSNKHGEDYCQKQSDNILQKLSAMRDAFTPDKDKQVIESFRKIFFSYSSSI